MKRKKDSVHKAAHIKANTLGTSNELSFDVLEAAKNQLDGKDGRSNEVVIKKPGKSVGVISLLFSRIAFQQKKEGDANAITSTSVVEVSTGKSKASTSVVATDSAAVLGGIQASGKKRHKVKKEKRVKKAEAVAQPARKPLLTQEDAQAEIDRRKKIRRRHKARVRVGIAIAVIAALGAGGYVAAQHIQLRSNQGAMFESAVNGISDVDPKLVILDELLTDPLGKVSDESWLDLKSNFETMRDSLSASTKTATTLTEDGATNEIRTASRQVIAACDARLAMMESGEQIFNEAERANSIKARLESTWATILNADATARRAAELLGSSTLDGPMEEATNRFAEASSAFSQSLQEILSLEQEYPTLDLSPYKAYLERRIEAVAYGINTAQALLSRNKNEAYAQVDLYNAADAAAASLAASLPITTATPVEEAYVRNVESYRQQYSDARLAASAADDVIREYLGVQNK